jgi:hypothetical protein
MRRCTDCGSWTEECECPIPPWRMEEYDVPTCEAFVRGQHRCCANVEPAHALCVVHLQAAGFRRCNCGSWVPPPAVNTRSTQCPACGALWSEGLRVIDGGQQ